MAECKIKENKARCNCSYETCSTKGMCCECLQSHWKSGELPACFSQMILREHMTEVLRNLSRPIKSEADGGK